MNINRFPGSKHGQLSIEPGKAFNFEAVGGSGPGTDPLAARLKRATAILNIHRARDRAFGTDIFANPAWDILLNVYVASLEGRMTTIEVLSEETGGNAATIARYVRLLESGNYIVRGEAQKTMRGISFTLSDTAVTMMDETLSTLTFQSVG